jgi:type I restriction enzyme S subunit
MHEPLGQRPTVPLEKLATVDPESLPVSGNPRFRFKYIDISAAADGRLTIPSESMELSEAPSRARRILKSGDVIMSTVRPSLKAFAQCNFESGNYIASTGFAVLRARENADAYFLLCAILSDAVAGQIERFAVGSNYPAINSSDVRRLRLPSFSLRTQQKISGIFTSIDTAIEKTEALIEKYQQIKAGLMHDLFTRGVLPNGQLRPPREQAPALYQETVIGWIPRDWRISRLEKILRDSGGHLQTGPFGSQLHAHEYQSEGVPVVMPQDINDGRIETDSIARISEKRAFSLAKHQLRVGDIIIARRGELSRAAAVSGTEQGWLCGTGCFLLRLGRTDLNHFFFSHVYRYDYIQRQIAGTQVGTTMPSLNNSVMGRVFFPCPTPEEQAEISARLSRSEREINSLKAHAEKLRRQKLGLMQDLLTGKVEVKVEQDSVEPVNA